MIIERVSNWKSKTFPSAQHNFFFSSLPMDSELSQVTKSGAAWGFLLLGFFFFSLKYTWILAKSSQWARGLFLKGRRSTSERLAWEKKIFRLFEASSLPRVQLTTRYKCCTAWMPLSGTRLRITVFAKIPLTSELHPGLCLYLCTQGSLNPVINVIKINLSLL